MSTWPKERRCLDQKFHWLKVGACERGVTLRGNSSKGISSWLQNSFIVGRCLKKKACCLQSSLAFGIGEKRLVGSFQGIKSPSVTGLIQGRMFCPQTTSMRRISLLETLCLPLVTQQSHNILQPGSSMSTHKHTRHQYRTQLLVIPISGDRLPIISCTNQTHL